MSDGKLEGEAKEERNDVLTASADNGGSSSSCFINVEVNDNLIEEAEELIESSQENDSGSASKGTVVHCIQIALSERLSAQDEEERSRQSSASATPLERSQEISPSTSLVIKEWSTLINLLARIPVKAQKGLSSFDLKLTCISTIGEEILVIGTNVGIVYWYNRRLDVLDRLRCEGIDEVTSVSCVGTVDYMAAAGNQAGLVTIFQIPKDSLDDASGTSGASKKQSDRKNKKIQKFLIQDLHKGPITALEWSGNGMKLFSGDQTGHVVLTDIDYDLVQIRSSILISENYEIVQLSYVRKNLLICSTYRSIIFSLEHKTFNKVGSLERKTTGKFGGLILSSAWDESPKVYSIRPGARLWVADLSGAVQHTIKFKELILSESQPEIHVIKKPNRQQHPLSQDVQFTKLQRFMKDYLITFHKDILYVIDPRNTLVVGVCKELRSILDVSVNKEEIFILESARNVIRLSAKPDKFCIVPSSTLSSLSHINYYDHDGVHRVSSTGESSISSTFLHSQNQQSRTELFSSSAREGDTKSVPDKMSTSISDFRFPQESINFLTSKLKETSERVIPKINPLLNTIKTVIEADVDIEDGQKLLQAGIPPPVVPLESIEISGFEIFTSPPAEEPAFVPEPERFQKITNLPFEEVVVEAAIKGVKRGRKSKGSKSKSNGIIGKVCADQASDSVSVSSAYSNTSGSDTNNVNQTSTLTNLRPSAGEVSPKSAKTSSSGGDGNDVMSVSEHPHLYKDQQTSDETPFSMSRSWSVGTLIPSTKVSKEELHLKEELLARRLKWPELLPDSVRNSEVFSEAMSQDSGLTATDKSPVGMRKVPEDDMLLDPSKDDGISDNYLTSPSMENGSASTTLCGEERSKDEEEEDDQDKYFTDIYTKYRNKDSMNSYNSVLSFGPPSGSSYISAGPSAFGPRASLQNESSGGCSDKTEVNGEVDGSITVPALVVEAIAEAQRESTDESKEATLKASEGSSSSSSEVTELESTIESKIVSEEHWRKWRLPGNIVQICLCDHYILCVGAKGNVYYSPLDVVTLQWKTAGYTASSMAISPGGNIVWRIHKGDLYSLSNLAGPRAPTANGIEEWTKLTYKKVVLTATVQRSFGWIVKVDGSLEFCTGLLETTMVPYFESVYTPWPIQEVTCYGHRLWGLTSDGRIVFRTGTSQHNPKGVDWLELRWSCNDVPPACSISCGDIRPEDGVASVWFSDINGDLYFTFEERDSRGAWIPWKVSTSSYLNFSSEVSQEKSKSVLLNSIKEVSKSIKSLVQQSGTKPGLYLASSKSSVWFAIPEAPVIYGNRNKIVGHYWKALRVDRGLTVPSNWTEMFANSVYKGHGYLWISGSKGNLFYLPPSGGKVLQIDLPMFADGKIVSVAPAPEALWVLSSTGDIYGRCGITSSDITGKEWRQISLSTLKSSQFIHISCGSDVSWAVDESGEIYLRVGSLRPPGMKDMSPAWNKVDSPTSTKGGTFSKVYVGTNGTMVWAIDTEHRVYVRQAVFPDYPIGTGWLLVKGLEAVSLSLSETAVWALTPEGHIYRRHGITKTNFVGDYWRKVPGIASAITVSLCDELWALTPDGHLLKHSRKVMELSSMTGNEGPSNFDDEEEDEDWELVCNP